MDIYDKFGEYPSLSRTELMHILENDWENDIEITVHFEGISISSI